MRTHRGFKVIRLMVVLLALSPVGVQAQSQPGLTAGGGPLANTGVPAVAPLVPGMPMAMAPSQMAYPPSVSAPVAGQESPYGYGAGPMQPYGPVAPMMYNTAPGTPQAFPTESAQPLPGGYDPQMAGFYGGPADMCPACGGNGCPECLGIGGFLAHGLSWLLPYSDGGICAPRWYDITADFVYLSRDKATRLINFTSDGVLGDIVLSTDNFDFDPSASLQLTGAYQVFAGGALEFTYLGLNNFSSSASVASPDNELFSIISDFGTNPIGGYDETDRSQYQSISYSSSIDSFELHLRRRWQGPNCRLQGSWLAGVRYLYLLEDFQYYTLGGYDPQIQQNRGSMTYDTTTKNSLTGFQAGGDMWTSIIPGISFGGELKAGIYGLYGQQSTHIIATTTSPPFTQEIYEKQHGDDLAFVGQGNIMVVYKTSPNWALRGGYTFMFLDGVALAPENFNATAPFSTGRTTQSLNDNGNVFYHGFTAGLEWMW